MEIRLLDAAHSADVRLPNEPFSLFGRMHPTYISDQWGYTVERFPADQITEMRFPDENYDFDTLTQNGFVLGAYEGNRCVGLAILQEGFFKYMYLHDLKVNRAFRRQNVAAQLLDAARPLCRARGYRGIYTQAQDNNLGACLFYLRRGFVIGGLDTQVYRGTPQAHKRDILFYWDFD